MYFIAVISEELHHSGFMSLPVKQTPLLFAWWVTWHTFTSLAQDGAGFLWYFMAAVSVCFLVISVCLFQSYSVNFNF